MNYRLKNLGIPGFNPVDAGYEITRPSHSFGPAVRGYYLLHFIISGKGKFERNGITYSLTEGQCFVIRPHELTYYEADATEPWHYVWLGFSSDNVPKCITERDVLDIPFSRHIFEQIEENVEYYNSAEGEGGRREAYLSSKAAELMAELHVAFFCPPESKAQSDLKIIKNYIDTKYAQDISIGDLSERFHLSVGYFSRAFKKNFGVSPQQYIVDKRLGEAARLMSVHGFSPSEAAFTVGYGDIYLFSKMFKKKYGISPRGYKKEHS